jgi:superoxide dismutase
MLFNAHPTYMACQGTLDVHWGKHHRAYVTNLNNQIKGKPLENKTLEEVWHVHSNTAAKLLECSRKPCM